MQVKLAKSLTALTKRAIKTVRITPTKLKKATEQPRIVMIHNGFIGIFKSPVFTSIFCLFP